METAYRDGPPPGFSGGFGEPSCDACHFGEPTNDPSGRIEIGGIGGEYEANRTYPLLIRLSHPGMAAAGFQLTARFAEGGAQAGTLAPDAKDSERVTIVTDREVEYALQRAPGSNLAVPDSATWTLLWTAPTVGGTVRFHLSANAANGDEGSSGDFIHTMSTEVLAADR